MTDKKLINGMTREELVALIAKAMVAYAEHVAKTGEDPLAKFRDKEEA